jgi:uncharacterized protein (DUF1800 family)
MDQIRSDIAHLYRRAGFGIGPDDLDALVGEGYEASVERLIAGLSEPDASAAGLPPPTFAAYEPPVGPPGAPAGRAAAQARNQVERQETTTLQEWWLDRMIATSTPLREKLTLLWHGHFATAISKVRDPKLMYLQNELFRRQGGGGFNALTQAVAKDGAIMVWLDTIADKKAHPNENFARELMELFTLGLGHYGQEDVSQGARAFTGWIYDRVRDQWSLQVRQHDDGIKTVLSRTGDLGGEDVVDIILAQQASAPFVVAKIWSHLAYPVGPTDPVVAELAPAFGSNPDVRSLVQAVLLHPAFRSTAARGGLVKEPIEYLVGAARALKLDAALRPTGGPGPSFPTGASSGVPPGPAEPTLVRFCTAMGQTPFDPPNVGGWGQNDYWLDTGVALARLQAVTVLTSRADLSELEALPAAQRLAAVARLLSVDGWGSTTAGALGHVASDPVSLVALAMAAPEYVLN